MDNPRGESGPVVPTPPTRWQRFRRWFRYYGHGPANALHIVVREARQYVRHWLSREVFLVACDRCETMRKHGVRALPNDGQLFCPTCNMRTFHKRIYYDHEEERHRELGI